MCGYRAVVAGVCDTRSIKGVLYVCLRTVLTATACFVIALSLVVTRVHPTRLLARVTNLVAVAVGDDALALATATGVLTGGRGDE